MCITCAVGAPGVGESLLNETVVTGMYVAAISGVFYLAKHAATKRQSVSTKQ